MTRPFDLQGHRGARGLFPENTIAGFLGAITCGVTSLELDIAVTADDIAVVSHDPRLDPDLTRDGAGNWIEGPGPLIRDLTLARLEAYDVGRLRPGSDTAMRFARQVPQDGARIPTLSAVFASTAASGMIIDAELKTDPHDPGLTVTPAAMAELVITAARDQGALDRLVVRSFDWRGLAWLQAHHPGIPLAWLSFGQTDPARVVAASGGQGTWAPYFEDLTPEAVAAAHAAGLLVKPWTVNAPGDMARLIAWGVDGICTDEPDVAVSCLAMAEG